LEESEKHGNTTKRKTGGTGGAGFFFFREPEVKDSRLLTVHTVSDFYRLSKALRKAGERQPGLRINPSPLPAKRTTSVNGFPARRGTCFQNLPRGLCLLTFTRQKRFPIFFAFSSFLKFEPIYICYVLVMYVMYTYGDA
jgi:hypothetical protein